MIERYRKRIIPVVDIKNGKVVHARKGEREKYKPLKTKLSPRADPIEFVRKLPFNRIYVADLDSILYKKPNLNLLKEIMKMRNVLLDIGIETYEEYVKYKSMFNCDVIVASESIKNENELEKISKTKGHPLFSIDIKDMKVISNFLPKRIEEAYFYLKENFGFKRFLFINLTCVGTLSMKNFDKFNFLKEENVEKYYGGGINSDSIENAFKIFNFLLIGTLLYNNWRLD